MTHISQFFSPPIIPDLKINENYGARYHSAQYGSCIKGVILTGVVNSNNQYHIFEKGHLIENSN